MFNLKMSKEMKKFWNLMLVALVMLGAAACTESEEVIDQQIAGVSFYAAFGDDDTRAYIDDADGDKKWSTIWESGDTLMVTDTDDNSSYTFVCTDAATGKFTCEDSAAANLVGKTVGISSDNNVHPRDSRLGKKALYVWTTGVEFTQDATIQLTSQTSFLRYTYEGEGDVTLKLEQQTSDGRDVYAFVDNNEATNEITFSGIKGENFVPFWCGVNSTDIERNATLSYSIDGVKVKETTINRIGWGKVYNLGTLTDPEPEYELSEIWGIAGDFNGWTAGTPEPMYVVDDMLVAFNLTNLNGGFKFVQNKGWDGAKGSQSTAAVASGEWLNCGDNNIAAADAAAYDVYFSAERSMYCLVPAGGVAPEIPEKQAIVWSLAGSYNNWSDNLMTATDAPNLFVVKGVELASGDEIKVKDSTTWDTSFGGGITNLNANSWMKAYLNGANIAVAKSGTYDVYFEYAEGAEYSKLYLIETDTDYTAAVEQTANGTLIPDSGETPDVEAGETTEWALVGAFSGWADKYFVTTTDANVVVLANVTMEAAQGFLVRKPSTEWNDKYGAGDVNYIKTDHYITTSHNGSDMCLESAGTYDFYFNISTKDIYVMTAGADYTTATKQTVSGKEPEQEEPEVTANMLYLKPNANWTQSNARFAAYFWGGTVGEKWVNMTDSDGDGIYELYIPEGYDYGCNVIFCRMNPSTTANNWNNKWNQTSDLTAPTDGKNLYTVKDGTWDKGGGTWSVK